MRPRRGAGKQWRRRLFASACAAAMLQFSPMTSASAQAIDPSPPQPQTLYGWREIWTGVDAAQDQWLLYSGMTVAPWSRDIYSDGWRIRIAGGYGRYGYDGWAPREPCGDATQNDACTEAGRKHRHYTVAHDYAEVLLGYYLQLGALTAKAFAGAIMSSERHLVEDPANDNDGTEYGFKGALELWLNMGVRTWSSLDLSYATARNETSARWRTGWRIAEHVSVGPELRYDQNIETKEGEWNGRGGGFIRYDWTGGEISFAGGVTGRVDEWDATDVSPYGTLNVLFQF